MKLRVTDTERLDWIVRNKASIEPPGYGASGWAVIQHRTQEADVAPRLRSAIDMAIAIDRERAGE